MIWLQLVSSFMSSNSDPLLGPYDQIDFDWDTIRLFSDNMRSAHVLEKDKEEGGYIYDGVVYNCFRIVDDPRRSNKPGPLLQFDKSKT